MLTSDNDDAEEANILRQLSERQRQTMESYVVDIESVASALLFGECDAEALNNAIRHAHKVAGSAGVFGYSQASKIARSLELAFPGITETENPDPDLPRRIAELVVELRDAIELDPEFEIEETNESGIPDPSPLESMTVILITDDREAMNKVRAKVHRQQTTVKVLRHSAILRKQLHEENFDLLLLDTSECPSDSFALCRSLREDSQMDEIPIIFITNPSSENITQLVLESGADDYLINPLIDNEIVLRINTRLERQRAQRHSTSRAKPHDEHSLQTTSTPRHTMSDIEMSRTEAVRSLDIVLVEDDETLSPLLIHTFKTRGLTVAHIDSGTDAVAKLTGKTPQLHGRVVLLDWDLPGQNGLSVLRAMAISGALENTSVIMLTGRSSEADVVSALELGAIDHIAKPFSVPVLMQRIQRISAKATNQT